MWSLALSFGAGLEIACFDSQFLEEHHAIPGQWRIEPTQVGGPSGKQIKNQASCIPCPIKSLTAPMATSSGFEAIVRVLRIAAASQPGAEVLETRLV